MSLKALADAVLERNHTRNHGATEDGNRVAQAPFPGEGCATTATELHDLSVDNLKAKAGADTDDRWNPELAADGYQWCLDCRHWGGQACSHPDNPFRQQQPKAPRTCRWYSESKPER